MSAADEVARLETETAAAVSAATVAQGAAAAAVSDAEQLKHQVTRDAAEAIRERDEEIERLKGEVSWMKEKITSLESATESTDLALLGLVTMLNPPTQEIRENSEPSTQVEQVSSVAVVDPLVAETKPLPAKTEVNSPPNENQPVPVAPSKQKRHKLL